jgi:hypothetical protein
MKKYNKIINKDKKQLFVSSDYKAVKADPTNDGNLSIFPENASSDYSGFDIGPGDAVCLDEPFSLMSDKDSQKATIIVGK